MSRSRYTLFIVSRMSTPGDSYYTVVLVSKKSHRLLSIFVFHQVAKCRFSKFGPSGGTQTHDALCVLPLNIINEKIYIFLYFWFVFLAAVSSVWLLYRLLTIFSFNLRVNVIYLRSEKLVIQNYTWTCKL